MERKKLPEGLEKTMKKGNKIFKIIFFIICSIPVGIFAATMISGDPKMPYKIGFWILSHFFLLVLIGAFMLIPLTWILGGWAFYQAVGWLGWKFNFIWLPLGIREAGRRNLKEKNKRSMERLRRWTPRIIH